MKVLVFGATGMVGQGVLRECLLGPDVDVVQTVGRTATGVQHTKLREIVQKDLDQYSSVEADWSGFDACFFCLGVSSAGMKEADYERVTYGITLASAEMLSRLNPRMTFIYVSGTGTDSSEKGSLMQARVKGKTENALMDCGFRKVYNFRPGFMKPTPGQQNIQWYYKAIGWLYPFLRLALPNHVSTMRDVGLAMIHSVLKGYSKPVLEIEDIKIAGDPLGVAGPRDHHVAQLNTPPDQHLRRGAVVFAGDRRHGGVIQQPADRQRAVGLGDDVVLCVRSA